MLGTQMTQKYLNNNFRRLDFETHFDLTWSLSLSKGIKKATSPFHAALFAREEAAWRESFALYPSTSSGTKKSALIIFKITLLIHCKICLKTVPLLYALCPLQNRR